MGWLLGCFKCTGEPQQIKSKKQSSDGANLVSGRANSAAVAHATSPEDLRRVRRSPSNLAVANSNGYVERGWLESSSSSFSENLGFKPNEANKFNRERSFRERLVQEANAVKQLGDEIKDLRSCHKVLEPLPDSFKPTSIKPENDKSGHGNYAHRSWLVSSLVTSNGLLFEASSRPSSPFSGLHEHGSLNSRRIQTSQSMDFYDDLGSSNASKCAELNTCRVESGVSDECLNGNGVNLQPTYCRVELQTEAAPSKHRIQSPPWTFSEANLDIANHKNSCIFESSDNLLLEHLDVSSLIEDSALITSWELSSGELHSEKWVLHDQLFHSFQVSCQEEGKLPQLSMQSKQKHLENGTDGNSSDSDSSCSMVIFEVPSDDGTGLFAQPLVGEDCCSSNGSPVQALLDGASCDKDFIHAASNIDHNAKARLLQADGCADIDGSKIESGSQSCFSSQFKLSKRLWSSTRKNPFERDLSMEGLLHDNDNNVDEVIIPYRHSEMQLMQKSKNSEDASKEDEQHPLLNASIESSESSNDVMVSYDECSDGHVGNHLQSSTPSFVKALVRQGSVEVFAFEDETVAMSIGDISAVSSPSEEENGDQRKKLRLGHSSSFERMQDSVSIVEDEQVQHSKTAFGDCHDSSLGARVGISNKLESSASEQLLDESCLEQTSNLSFTSSPLSRVQTPMTSYRSPASLADDRPILGTVAAHWSPIATKKWWDGKGIPNSTNKYKEDQKVNWHAIPFEVRLEQALAKQESVFSK